MKKIHFIGIGGISMSGIAQIMKSRGYTVTGSDRSETDITRRLEMSGISVTIGQKAENITSDMDIIVYTAAVHEDNPELIAARASGARVIERAVMLGELLDEFAVPVGVAGTHGKTSTSSMLAYIYMAADLCTQIFGDFHLGTGDRHAFREITIRDIGYIHVFI